MLNLMLTTNPTKVPLDQSLNKGNINKNYKFVQSLKQFTFSSSQLDSFYFHKCTELKINLLKKYYACMFFLKPLPPLL